MQKVNLWLFVKAFLLANLVFLPLINCKKTTDLESGYIYNYSKAEINEQKKESNLSHKYFNSMSPLTNPYHDFIVSSLKHFEDPASTHSKKKFDNLYDDHTAIRKWETFADLHYSLTTTKLSKQVKLNINWPLLYHEINLDNDNINALEQLQLRFYNIISKLYKTKNIIRLTQKISIDKSLNYLSKTIYYPLSSATTMSFSPFFCDQKLINSECSKGHIISNTPIVGMLREYGQALLTYAYNSNEQRKSFNTYTVDNKANNSMLLFKGNNGLSHTEIFKDATRNLISSLINYCGIDTNNDPVKKLLIPFLIVNSTNAWEAWSTNNVNLRDNFFLEAFTKWIGTPAIDRTFAWQLLNAYFIKVFPYTYHL